MSHEEMSDLDISKAVADKQGIYWHLKPHRTKTRDCWEYSDNYNDCCAEGGGVAVDLPDYCNNPSDAWPIIIENKIGGHWGRASPGLYFAVSRCEKYVHADSNPLRAYMIIYLRMNEDNG